MEFSCSYRAIKFNFKTSILFVFFLFVLNVINIECSCESKVVLQGPANSNPVDIVPTVKQGSQDENEDQDEDEVEFPFHRVPDETLMRILKMARLTKNELLQSRLVNKRFAELVHITARCALQKKIGRTLSPCSTKPCLCMQEMFGIAVWDTDEKVISNYQSWEIWELFWLGVGFLIFKYDWCRNWLLTVFKNGKYL